MRTNASDLDIAARQTLRASQKNHDHASATGYRAEARVTSFKGQVREIRRRISWISAEHDNQAIRQRQRPQAVIGRPPCRTRGP